MTRDVVRGIVDLFLDKNPDEIVRINSEDTALEVIEEAKGNRSLRFVWIDGGGGDIDGLVYVFWRLLREDCLCAPSYIIFTGATNNPEWRDLDMYEGVKFGSLYLLVCDGDTLPSVKPSQRGIFNA